MKKTTYATAATLQAIAPGILARGGVMVDVCDGRKWDYRGFGQSVAARRGRVERMVFQLNSWKVRDGLWSLKELRTFARYLARTRVSLENLAGARYVFTRGGQGTVRTHW